MPLWWVLVGLEGERGRYYKGEGGSGGIMRGREGGIIREGGSGGIM